MAVLKKATRDGFGDAIVEIGKENSNIYVIDADIGSSCKTYPFRAALPMQYVNVGIAESTATAVAAGLATTGKIPFVVTYAVFGSMRNAETIRNQICYPELNVKIACSHGGLTPGNDGASHQAVEDMGVLRSIPNMTVVMPADYYSTKTLVKAASEYEGPVYLRFTRDAVPIIYNEEIDLEIGKANELVSGDDVVIIANGDTVIIALEAANELINYHIKARVLDMHTIKPLDVDAVRKAIDEVGKIITIEDHNIINGLGSAVAEQVAERGKGILRRIGIQDAFGESAPYARLLEKNGITKENVVKLARELFEI